MTHDLRNELKNTRIEGGFKTFLDLRFAFWLFLRQPQAAAVLVDLEAHFAAVNFRDPAELREFLRKARQTLFQIRVVGGDLHHGIGLVEVNLSGFLLLVQMLLPPNSYIPNPGDIIYFDWDKEESNGQDGLTDHVGIVDKVENGYIYTIEGNSGDLVSENTWAVGYYEIYGFGVPIS